jgi:hypothetical protein
MNEILTEGYLSMFVEFMTDVDNTDHDDNVYTLDLQKMPVKRFSVKALYDQAQVETATVVGTISTEGNAAVIVTAAGMTGSPKTIDVPVAVDDNAAAIAGKIRTALAADTAVAAKFVVGGATDKVVLTAKVCAANDTTLNISVADGTCVGITAAESSANTTVGGAVAKSFAFTNSPNARGHMVVEIDYVGNPAITWPDNVSWQSEAPVFTAGKVYKLEFFTRDGGATWYGLSLGGW